jgi:hypothetical protein
MTARSQIFRFIVGVPIVALILVAAFIVLAPFIHTWGATDEEINHTYPGDELTPNPVLRWTHGITIHAPVSETWKWVIQMGESRGGYYSYTFIENLIAGSTLYINADHIIEEFQNPPIGQEMIGGMLSIQSYEKEHYLLASSEIDELGWTWLWFLSPTEDGQTRLVVRMNIEPEKSLSIPAPAMWIMDAGGFVMEQNMLQGIKLRAEGGREFRFIEVIEIAIWLVTLLIGLIAAWLFITQPKWPLPFSTGIDVIIVLIVFTFVQPAIWIRLLLMLVLLAELGWSFQLSIKQEESTAPRETPAISIPWEK